MMALAMTATALTGCEDVPAPYSMNFDDSNVTPTPKPAAEPKGTGTEADPFNVAAALKYIEPARTSTSRCTFPGQSQVSRRLM